MKEFICRPHGGQGSVKVEAYEYPEFRKRFWPDGVGVTTCTQQNKTTGSEEIVQMETFKTVCCDLCSKRIPPFAADVCIGCCHQADLRGDLYTKPECGECHRPGSGVYKNNTVYVLDVKNYILSVGDGHKIKADGLWGMCEKCFKAEFDIIKAGNDTAV